MKIPMDAGQLRTILDGYRKAIILPEDNAVLVGAFIITDEKHTCTATFNADGTITMGPMHKRPK